MYQALLTRRYLFSKVMPLLASAAVLLCTAMVLITWSVMGGFLNMLINTGRTMTGDVTIQWPQTGFAYYDDLIERLEKDPAVEAAAPLIETFAIIHLPDGRNEPVELRGVDGPSYAKVTRYADILWWRPLVKPLPKDNNRKDPRLHGIDDTSWEEILENGLKLERKDPTTGEMKPALVMGIEVSAFNVREQEGFYSPGLIRRRMPDGGLGPLDMTFFMPRSGQVTVNVLPLDSTGKGVQTATGIFPVANEFESGLYEADNKVVLIRIDALQKLLLMNKVEAAPAPHDAQQFPTGDTSAQTETPARATHVLVKGKGEMSAVNDAKALKKRVEAIYEEFAAAHRGQVPESYNIRIMTWRELNGTFITAVEKETALVLVLFIFMSITAVLLVLAIFWSMISEKTKDIGILRSLGASRLGVAWLWVRYGLAIGAVGAALGGSAGFLIVHYINPIHEWMGRSFLHITIWDPKIYYFITIPNKVDRWQAAEVMVGFTLSCAVGALIPAWRAAVLHPVKALRFE
jgi:lipoprotein-releasing system permease protein